MPDQERLSDTEHIAFAMTRDEWIALLACADLGVDIAENIHGGFVAGTAEGLMVYMRQVLKVSNLRAAADEYEARREDEEDGHFNPPHITPSA